MASKGQRNRGARPAPVRRPGNRGQAPAWAAGGRGRGARASTAVPVVRPDPVLARDDGWWALACAALAAVVFASSFAGHVSLGDAPEYVGGVDSLGVLHSPGYPGYVLLAWAFTNLVPVGEAAWRVNLFSLLCASGAVGVTYLLGRLVGAARIPAAVGALVLATGTAFWFYAGFAKHYALSSLLAAVAMVAAASWLRRPGMRRAVLTGASLALLAGATWQIGALVGVGVAAAAVLRWRRELPWREALVGAGASLAGLALLYGYVVVRAPQDPFFNWGRVVNAERLVDLVTLEDFGFGTDTFRGDEDGGGRGDAGGGGGDREGRAEERERRDARRADRAVTPTSAVTDVLRSPPVYGALATREFGIPAVLLALIGVVAGARRGAKAAGLVVAAVGVVSAAGAAVIVLPARVRGFETTLVQGGFLVSVWIPVAVAVGLGVDAGGRWAAARLADRRGAGGGGRIAPAVALALGAVAVVPAVVTHRELATHDAPAFADAYATNVLEPLPERAVVIVLGAERAFPLWYAQSVHGLRPDVDVLAADGLTRRWYRDQVEERLDVRLPSARGGQPEATIAVAERLAETRPVYLDMLAVQVFGDEVAYAIDGLVAELVDASNTGTQRPESLEDVEAVVAAYDVEDVYEHPRRNDFPFSRMLSSYGTMHRQLAHWYLLDENWERAAHHLGRALALAPDDDLLRQRFRFAVAQAGG